jgi:hypothetical protein
MDRVERRAAVVTGVEIAFTGSHLDVERDEAAGDLGHALHFAWWRTKETIGRPGSHGCVNLLLDDARRRRYRRR